MSHKYFYKMSGPPKNYEFDVPGCTKESKDLKKKQTYNFAWTLQDHDIWSNEFTPKTIISALLKYIPMHWVNEPDGKGWKFTSGDGGGEGYLLSPLKWLFL